MYLRTLWVTGVMMLAAGCGAAPATGGAKPSPVGTTPTPMLRCPDGRCGDPNGTGIYTSEDGAAGIGANKLMIMHFINTGTEVRFDGMYFDATTGGWRWLSEPGTVYGADYGVRPPGAGPYAVKAVDETATAPTWTIYRVPDNTLPVSGADLRLLTLYISVAFPGSDQGKYALKFDNAPDVVSRNHVTRYDMSWRDLHMEGVRWNQYCLTRAAPSPAPSAPAPTESTDQVVFQGGIDVDPQYGWVIHDQRASMYVTLSCFQGAPATVYGWGYKYRAPADTFYFDAGIHMKRASYCADGNHYTVAGTHILRFDDIPVSSEAIGGHVEAIWTAAGASCVDPRHARHPELIKSNLVQLNGSDGGEHFVCTNGKVLPICSNTPPEIPRPLPHHFLADGLP